MSASDASSIRLNNTIPPSPSFPITIGDYDNDTNQDLRVKFDRKTVSNFIISQGIMTGNVTLTIRINDTIVQLHGGTLFEGRDTIKVRMTGDVNIDGKIDGKDIAVVAQAFASGPSHPRWKPIADENEDSKIDGKDFALIARNFGKTYP